MGLYGHKPTEPWHFTDWIIDTTDADPRFGSDRGVKVQVPTTKFDDNPGIVQHEGAGPLPASLHWKVDARVGVYPWGPPIPSDIAGWESTKPTPFQEVAWGWEITVPPSQDSLDINFK
jgi:hypothetical protein